MAGRDDDRYEPLPGLLGIPGFLYRKLSLRGRHLALIGGGLLIAGIVAFAVFAWPAIQDAKDEREAKREQELAESRAERIRQQREEMTVMRERARIPGLAGSGAEMLAARDMLLQELAGSIEEDARARVESGALESEIERVKCDPFPRTAERYDPADDPEARFGRYECVAVTATIPETEANVGGVIGYPFRARVSFESGRYAWCKISGHPGEGGFTYQREVGVPVECGGSD